MNNGNLYDDPIQNTRILPERVAYFKFSDYAPQTAGENDHLKPPVKIDGLNVRFRVHQLASVGYAGAYEGEFGICNLDRETMAELANIYEAPKFENQSGYRRVQFYAGYKKAQAGSLLDGAALVLDGNILKTHVSSGPPDIWFEFRAFTEWKTVGEITFDGGDKGFDFAEIVAIISQKCGFGTPIYKAGKHFTIKKITFSGTYQKILEDLEKAAAMNDLRIMQKFSQDQKISLVVCDRKMEIDQLQGVGNNTWLISDENGMIGVPELSFGHATVTTVFNPHIRPLDIVNLKSKLMPYWNDRFFVARLEHFGELRGKDFCTRLDLIKEWK